MRSKKGEILQRKKVSEKHQKGKKKGEKDRETIG